jgi:hypothetical protein
VIYVGRESMCTAQQSLSNALSQSLLTTPLPVSHMQVFLRPPEDPEKRDGIGMCRY